MKYGLLGITRKEAERLDKAIGYMRRMRRRRPWLGCWHIWNSKTKKYDCDYDKGKRAMIKNAQYLYRPHGRVSGMLYGFIRILNNRFPAAFKVDELIYIIENF